jgi:undecaprenyl-diphosphatase
LLTYFQAITIGLMQGVTELFPISSLGHSILLPSLFGWHSVVRSQSADESFYLAFLVGLHVATALALLVFYRREWAAIIRGLARSVRRRRIESADERLAWLLVTATIPAGITGLALEHTLRTIFAKPLAAAVFLVLNGLILLAGERLRRRTEGGPGRIQGKPACAEGKGGIPGRAASGEVESRGLDTLAYREAGIVGVAQTLALLPGISRSGITMVAGLVRGLDHEDAARFSFLLATPIILAAGVYKLPDLLGPNGDHIRGQVLAGSLAAGAAAYLSVRFLVRYFTSRDLTPFAIYCLAAGVLAILRFS